LADPVPARRDRGRTIRYDARMGRTRHCRLALGALFGCALVLGGCATMAPREEPEAAPDAERLYQQGDLEHAAQAFMDLASRHSGDRDHYRLRAAEAYREEGNLDASAQALAGIKPRRLDADEATRFALLDAEIALAHNDAAHALERLEFADDNLPLPLRQRTFELRARALAANGDALGSARARAALNRMLGGADRAQNEAQIVDTLRRLGPDALKRQADTLAANDALRPWLNQALHSSGQALPQIVLRPNQPVGTLMPGAQNDTVAREGYHPAHRVAVLLPVNGPLKTIAQAIRDGILTAYFGDANPQRPEVRTYDSGDTPQQAVEAYQHAVADGAERVIGPLRRDAVSAVFAQGRLPVPVLTLNQADRGEVPPHGSAAFGLVPDSEAAQAAEHALELGFHSAVIITATDDWAERAALAFRAQFENHNGEILGDARVRDGEINYAATIRQALASVPATTMAPALPGAVANPADAPAAPPAVAIFISMRPQQARLLLPQLKLAGYTGLPVIATSHIYSGSPDPGQDRDLDGVEFCDAPWLFDATTLGLPRYSDVARVLDSVHGAGARLFALGLDSYALLPYLDWLAQHHEAYLPGATGQLSEDELDRIQRLLVWARFDGGLARPINGSLQVTPAAPAAP
jgi:outer membrane PBP1 activator LpoA protein